MKHTLKWDYTSLSESYHKRPNYPQRIIEKIIDLTGLKRGNRVCDIGAGTGNLSLLLADSGLHVQALEPNLAMYGCRIRGTRNNPMVKWVNTTAEDTRLTSKTYDAVSFGSSFNVVNREAALKESLRICKPGGWLVAIWNHRDLDDPIQKSIETCIKERLPSYDYGLRRLDQRKYLVETGLFSQVDLIETDMLITQSVTDVLQAWRSHATLQRQAGKRFDEIVQEIDAILFRQVSDTIEIPYTCRAWVSRFHKHPA